MTGASWPCTGRLPRRHILRKRVALQEGFDAAFARSGAPRGRELGVLRGLATAHLLPHLPLLPRRPARVREIVDKLAAGRFRPNEEATVLHSAGADAQCGTDEGQGQGQSPPADDFARAAHAARIGAA
ncbi:hypothetical protein EDB89DRAFT_2001523 [Lactarius sanguifluus]|nr:hypothetical protein EDB89DRAFT_2001523 [Lactarius sanguifluus]